MSLSNKCVILVVDDEETFRETTVALLLRDGYEAKGCASTAAALDAIRSGPPGLLICDINMPGNAELEFIREVHAASPGLPVILITGYPTVQTAASAVTLGVVAYLLKPVVPSELMKLVAHTVLQRQACLRVEQNLNRVEAWNRAPCAWGCAQGPRTNSPAPWPPSSRSLSEMSWNLSAISAMSCRCSSDRKPHPKSGNP